MTALFPTAGRYTYWGRKRDRFAYVSRIANLDMIPAATEFLKTKVAAPRAPRKRPWHRCERKDP